MPRTGRANSPAGLLVVLVLGLGACDSSDPGPGFAQAVVPVLNRHCVMCHMEGGAQGELSLHPDPHANLVGVASTQSDLLLVAAGNVEASYLYHKLTGSHLQVGGEGDSMPYQRDLLAAKDIATLRRWIERGAANN
jgi:hypothetical protein